MLINERPHIEQRSYPFKWSNLENELDALFYPMVILACISKSSLSELCNPDNSSEIMAPKGLGKVVRLGQSPKRKLEKKFRQFFATNFFPEIIFSKKQFSKKFFEIIFDFFFKILFFTKNGEKWRGVEKIVFPSSSPPPPHMSYSPLKHPPPLPLHGCGSIQHRVHLTISKVIENQDIYSEDSNHKFLFAKIQQWNPNLKG